MRSESCRRVEENKKKATEYVEELEKKLKEEKNRKDKQNPSPYQIKEFTLDSEVGPKLTTIQERQGSIRSSLKFHKVNEEPIDEDQDVEKLRKRLLRKYSSVFKRDLGRVDRINIDPVRWRDMVPRDNVPRDNLPQDNLPRDNPPRRQSTPGDNMPRRQPAPETT